MENLRKIGAQVTHDAAHRVADFGSDCTQKIRKKARSITWKLSLAGGTSLLLAAAILLLADKPVQAKLAGAFSTSTSRAATATAKAPTPSSLAANPTGTLAAEACPKTQHALEGIASWYGAVLNGHRTASGERFNMYELTACHKTLPFGTIVRVVNQETGRTVDVRINDRGVLKEGRIIDLSFAAAAKLGIVKSGLAEVKLQIIKMGNGHHHWMHDAPDQKVVVLPPPDGYNGPMNIAQR